MPEPATLAAFALISLGLVLTPGPNMLYLVSRSITQGRVAGLISLGGVACGFLVWLLAACVGLAALVAAAPGAFLVVKLAGAAYLLWLAWQTIRPGGQSVFAPRRLEAHSPSRLFAMGLTTNLLNPKAAVLYASLLPQFVDPGQGSVLMQSLALGLTQISVSLVVNTMWVVTAGAFAVALARRPLWQRLQRWLMATVLSALALRLATEPAR